AGAPGSARRFACLAEARCARGTARSSAATVRRRPLRARVASFRRSLIELLLHPHTVRVQLQRLRKRLPRLRVFIFLAQADAEPQVGFRVLRIELDGFPEIGARLLRAAPELGGKIVVADALR